MIPRILVPTLLFVSAFAGSAATAKDTARVLFDFSAADANQQWQIVNDGVMGGRSTSRATMAAEGQMRFAGNLSLENNGGFASVRSKPGSLQLNSGDVIVLRVRGDGRKYTFNLYVPGRRTAFSFRTEFKTEADQWMEIRLPLDKFVATSFGRVVRGAMLDPREVNSVGILLGDKRAGPFQILIDSIKVQPASP
jgi:monofunctional biosynthetic peptidoglycan transglycosylase